MMTFVPVLPVEDNPNVIHAYERLRPSVEMAGDTVARLAELHHRGVWTIWRGFDRVLDMFLVLEQSPMGLMIPHMTGDAGTMDHLPDFEAWLTEFARCNGHKKISIWGRPAYLKIGPRAGMTDRGWKVTRVLCEKEIADERDAD